MHIVPYIVIYFTLLYIWYHTHGGQRIRSPLTPPLQPGHPCRPAHPAARIPPPPPTDRPARPRSSLSHGCRNVQPDKGAVKASASAPATRGPARQRAPQGDHVNGAGVGGGGCRGNFGVVGDVVAARGHARACGGWAGRGWAGGLAPHLWAEDTTQEGMEDPPARARYHAGPGATQRGT